MGDAAAEREEGKREGTVGDIKGFCATRLADADEELRGTETRGRETTKNERYTGGDKD